MDDAGARAATLLARHRPGYALERELYADAGLFELELERIWHAGWLFAAHSGELRRPGARVALDVGDEPVVVVRQHDGSVRAFHNVCRHRGSVVAGAGVGALLVCPYHRWSYDLDGSLRSCPGAPEDVDRAALALGELAALEAGGLVLVSLSTVPPDASGWCEALNAAPEAASLARAKVAARVEYEIAADWKLVWENNRECLHCVSNHPQYVPSNFDVVRSGDTVPGGLAEFPDSEGSAWWSETRAALRPPYVTESMDGLPVAPPLGAAGPGVGRAETWRLRMLPSFWAHVSADHAVTTRVLPAGPDRTRAVVSWLVDPEAVEGTDYDLDRLMPFWRLTSEQDWAICERQQRGVRSRAYRPGPLSPQLETNVANFHAWYADRLRA